MVNELVKILAIMVMFMNSELKELISKHAGILAGEIYVEEVEPDQREVSYGEITLRRGAGITVVKPDEQERTHDVRVPRPGMVRDLLVVLDRGTKTSIDMGADHRWHWGMGHRGLDGCRSVRSGRRRRRTLPLGEMTFGVAASGEDLLLGGAEVGLSRTA